KSVKFDEEFMGEERGVGQHFNALRAESQHNQIEQVGKELRGMMPWISAGKRSVTEVSGGD
ncbi:MAG: Ketol-acid reductoisomerase, partial [Acidimicrobiales bacterium]|nr:Ketol-acid reductoisomerase [Acidimicrobiales bacterium]